MDTLVFYRCPEGYDGGAGYTLLYIWGHDAL